MNYYKYILLYLLKINSISFPIISEIFLFEIILKISLISFFILILKFALTMFHILFKLTIIYCIIYEKLTLSISKMFFKLAFIYHFLIIICVLYFPFTIIFTINKLAYYYYNNTQIFNIFTNHLPLALNLIFFEFTIIFTAVFKFIKAITIFHSIKKLTLNLKIYLYTIHYFHKLFPHNHAFNYPRIHLHK